MRVRGRRIRDNCPAKDIVRQDETARLEQPVWLAWLGRGQNNIQVCWVRILVGVQEDEIEWFRGLQGRQTIPLLRLVLAERNGARDASRFNTIANLDLRILDAMLLKGLARDVGVLLAQLQADDLAVFAHGVRPGQAGEADVDTELEDYEAIC